MAAALSLFVQSTGVEAKEAVKAAIACGYRLLDGAYGYGNEAAVGEALAEVFKEGSVCREDVFIISKVPRSDSTACSSVLLLDS